MIPRGGQSGVRYKVAVRLRLGFRSAAELNIIAWCQSDSGGNRTSRPAHKGRCISALHVERDGLHTASTIVQNGVPPRSLIHMRELAKGNIDSLRGSDRKLRNGVYTGAQRRRQDHGHGKYTIPLVDIPDLLALICGVNVIENCHRIKPPMTDSIWPEGDIDLRGIRRGLHDDILCTRHDG